MSNLLINPGFELSTPPSVSPGWVVTSGEIVTINNPTRAHTGDQYALTINTITGVDSMEQDITVVGGTKKRCILAQCMVQYA